ncbi:hypothetical protein J6590_025708 [Homalodisca vitripennis]|nr:hypothetical protein J6590_025708 [Homalodisca vitripennis]
MGGQTKTPVNDQFINCLDQKLFSSAIKSSNTDHISDGKEWHRRAKHGLNGVTGSDELTATVVLALTVTSAVHVPSAAAGKGSGGGGKRPADDGLGLRSYLRQ